MSLKLLVFSFSIIILATNVACVPLIMAGVAHNREKQAEQDQDNTLACWQEYRDEIEELPDIALLGLKAQRKQEQCHVDFSGEADMCAVDDANVETLRRHYVKLRSNSREDRKTCERMDLETSRSVQSAQSAREAAVNAANRMANDRSVYCTSNRAGNTISTWCN